MREHDKQSRQGLSHAGPLCLSAYRDAFGTRISWRGRARPGVIGLDLYAWRLTPEGRVPMRLNTAPLPLEGECIDPDPSSASLLEPDGFALFIDGPTQALPDADPVWHRQRWIEHLCEGPNALLRRCCGTKHPPLRADDYFLIDRYGNDRQGDPTVIAERTWTPDLDRERDERIREAWRKIRERELTRGLPGNPTADDLERHIRGGIQGDRGELESEGRTWPDGKPDPQTGKGMSTLTLNGNAVLDADPEQLIALLLHELTHVAQNMNGTVPGELKPIAIDRINRETGAYSHVWDKILSGELPLRPGLQAREALEATRALVDLFKKFAEIVMGLETKPSPEQRDALREMRRRLRELLLRYKSFLDTVPAPALGMLVTMGPDGKVMNAKEFVDYLLKHTFN